jgi:hypothetical protein
MWTYEHSVQTTAPPGRIWSLWADVDTWAEWNGDIERIELIGPFATGSTIVMTPIGGEPVTLRIAEVVEPEVGAGAAEITYRTEIAGPDADTQGAEIGTAITADFPQTLAALTARAETA